MLKVLSLYYEKCLSWPRLPSRCRTISIVITTPITRQNRLTVDVPLWDTSFSLGGIWDVALFVNNLIQNFIILLGNFLEDLWHRMILIRQEDYRLNHGWLSAALWFNILGDKTWKDPLFILAAVMITGSVYPTGVIRLRVEACILCSKVKYSNNI